MVKCAGHVNVAFGVSMRTVVAVYTCVCVRMHACMWMCVCVGSGEKDVE